MEKRNKRLFWTILLIISLPVAYVSFWIGDLYGDLDEFSIYVKNNEAFGVERLVGEKHDDIRDHYGKTDKWFLRWTGLKWLSNRTIFKDAQFYAGITAYNRGDYDSARRLLGPLSDHRAKRLAGSAGFHLLRESCLRGQCEDENDPLVRDIRYNFEEALRFSPDGTFQDIWNYDWVADSTAFSNSIRQQPTERAGRLQIERDDDGEEMLPEEDEEQEINRLPQQDSRGGSGNRRRTP